MKDIGPLVMAVSLIAHTQTLLYLFINAVSDQTVPLRFV